MRRVLNFRTGRGFQFIWFINLLPRFCIFCLPNILQKVLEHLHSSSHLILTQIFGPFDCLQFLRCNFSCKFSIIGLTSGLIFPCKVLSLYLNQESLIFSCKVMFLKKNEKYFFSSRFCIFQLVTCGVEVIFHIFMLKKYLCAYEEVIWKGIIKIT